MSWGTPLTAVFNAALTAAQWNASVRDNLLETSVAKASAAGQIFVATGTNSLAARIISTDVYAGGGTDSTNSTSYIGLTGGGALTATTGVSALVNHWSSITNDTAGTRSYASYAVSNASTIAAADAWALIHDASSAGRTQKGGLMYKHTGLTAGSNTFTQQFKVAANTGTFLSRGLVVIPL